MIFSKVLKGIPKGIYLGGGIMWHMWDVSSGMGWWMAFGGLWMLIFWDSLIALIVWGTTKLSRRDSSSSRRDLLDVAKRTLCQG